MDTCSVSRYAVDQNLGRVSAATKFVAKLRHCLHTKAQRYISDLIMYLLLERQVERVGEMIVF
jgi:hypothetical protein